MLTYHLEYFPVLTYMLKFITLFKQISNHGKHKNVLFHYKKIIINKLIEAHIWKTTDAPAHVIQMHWISYTNSYV